jgi:allantoicase
MAQIPLDVISYDDSGFTNAHDVVSFAPVQDGRGTFTHLGVRMEGLESARHLNFSATATAFRRDANISNRIVLRVRGGKARVEAIELDTRFYTRNHTRDIYTIRMGLSGRLETVVEGLKLDGDSVRRVPIQSVDATDIELVVGEGGLARIRLFGQFTPVEPQASVLDNAVVFGASDASYGDPSLILRPTRQGSYFCNRWY